MMNKEQRNELIEQYVDRMLDGMDWKDLAVLAGDGMIANLEKFSDDELIALVAMIEKKGTYLLIDETYREMVFGQGLPVAATLSDRVISISSMSKAFGLPGIRIGWMICKNPKLMELFLAAKEQITITNSVLDEEIAF